MSNKNNYYVCDDNFLKGLFETYDLNFKNFCLEESDIKNQSDKNHYYAQKIGYLLDRGADIVKNIEDKIKEILRRDMNDFRDNYYEDYVTDITFINILMTDTANMATNDHTCYYILRFYITILDNQYMNLQKLKYGTQSIEKLSYGPYPYTDVFNTYGEI